MKFEYPRHSDVKIDDSTVEETSQKTSIHESPKLEEADPTLELPVQTRAKSAGSFGLFPNYLLLSLSFKRSKLLNIAIHHIDVPSEHISHL